ncbi:alpha/beta fold hydrolase [Flavihumibacter solisilvae]|uniref:alpha/beta fold hydrolase n=1 Tax=Flavihumibacter solisilvae TaxID=1349421 RepID=UPI00068CEC97|nr:alpha/beta hydrolase [Flavihumibacter solisilvae]
MKKSYTFLAILLFLFIQPACKDSSKTTATLPGPATAVKSVWINGDSIHYIEQGQGSPIIFVHGTLGDYRAWQGQMDTFSRQHRVIAYSRRYAYPNNQGVSDAADYSIVPHASDLAEFIKALNIGPVHLAGHSYGAFTILATAINHPELVSSLTLGEPPVTSLLKLTATGDSIYKQFVDGTLNRAKESYGKNDTSGSLAVFITGVIGDSLFYSKIPPADQASMKMNMIEYQGILNKQDFSPALTCDELKKITVPVLILQGERTPAFFSAINTELDRCLTNKSLIILPNSSHGLQAENPSGYNKIVLEFINKHSN